MKVVLVDDHEVVRAGLATLISKQKDMKVVGQAATVFDALRVVGYKSPDVVVIDVRLPDGSGVDACRQIKERWPDTSVLMLTSFADDEALYASIMAGASGYVLKRVTGPELVDNIRRVGDGESLLDPILVESVFRRIRGEEEDPLLARLSPQERNIMEHLAEGLTNRQIAEQMFLAEKTVKNYVSNVLAKLGMSRRSEVAAYAARREAEREQRAPAESWEER
jgi:DNA-binding NarL/FixJ family response regulator